MSLDEAEVLVELAVDRGLRLGVCHTLRFAEPYVRALEHLASSGDPPHHVIARSLSHRLTDVGWTGRPRSWTDDLLWHHGGHMIDLILRVLGDPDTVVRGARVQSIVGRSRAGDVPMDYSIQLTTADGRIASIALSYTSLIPATDLIAIAAQGSVEVTAGMVRTSEWHSSGRVIRRRSLNEPCQSRMPASSRRYATDRRSQARQPRSYPRSEFRPRSTQTLAPAPRRSRSIEDTV